MEGFVHGGLTILFEFDGSVLILKTLFNQGIRQCVLEVLASKLNVPNEKEAFVRKCSSVLCAAGCFTPRPLVGNVNAIGHRQASFHSFR